MFYIYAYILPEVLQFINLLVVVFLNPCLKISPAVLVVGKLGFGLDLLSFYNLGKIYSQGLSFLIYKMKELALGRSHVESDKKHQWVQLK